MDCEIEESVAEYRTNCSKNQTKRTYFNDCDPGPSRHLQSEISLTISSPSKKKKRRESSSELSDVITSFSSKKKQPDINDSDPGTSRHIVSFKATQYVKNLVSI